MNIIVHVIRLVIWIDSINDNDQSEEKTAFPTSYRGSYKEQ